MALLQERLVILDGAMGTMIQRHALSEEQFRGERFAAWRSDLRGNNDLLSLTQPQIIAEPLGIEQSKAPRVLQGLQFRQVDQRPALRPEKLRSDVQQQLVCEKSGE